MGPFHLYLLHLSRGDVVPLLVDGDNELSVTRQPAPGSGSVTIDGLEVYVYVGP